MKEYDGDTQGDFHVGKKSAHSQIFLRKKNTNLKQAHLNATPQQN
jgi:hypothetical protein